jgi:hypothetical protein
VLNGDGTAAAQQHIRGVHPRGSKYQDDGSVLLRKARCGRSVQPGPAQPVRRSAAFRPDYLGVMAESFPVYLSEHVREAILGDGGGGRIYSGIVR